MPVAHSISITIGIEGAVGAIGQNFQAVGKSVAVGVRVTRISIPLDLLIIDECITVWICGAGAAAILVF
jgi:hypothetical protein